MKKQGGKMSMNVFFIMLILVSLMIVMIITPYVKDAFIPNDLHDAIIGFTKDGRFVDYEIAGDQISFRYAIVFFNKADEKVGINVGVEFNERDLEGWIDQDVHFMNTGGEQWLEPSEQKELIFTFGSKYLGGPVNTQLPFPRDVSFIVNAISNSVNRAK